MDTEVAGTRRTAFIGGAPTQERAIFIHDVPTHEIMAINDRMATTTERLEADLKKVDIKIPRFPRGLRGIGGDGGRYIAPSVVAIGPYHHGLPHLEKMEEVKLAAAHYLCRDSGSSTVEVYERVVPVARHAHGCYDADDPAVAGLSDSEFASMMFLDGCFLLQYIVGSKSAPVLRNRMVLSMGPSIQKDIFLLENQIPWMVLEALLELMPVDVSRFANEMANKFVLGKTKPKKHRRRMQWGCIPEPDIGDSNSGNDYRPPHLLGLLRFTQVGSMPPALVNYRGLPSSSLSSGAVELSEIGIRLTPSKATWFGDMSVRLGLLFGKLSVSPVLLNDVTACWLVNMAALEASTAASSESDGYIVSSYLSVLAMLMDREEDVHQLRAKLVVYSTFSNTKTLDFFKGLAQHLRLGGRYFAILEAIDSYKRRRVGGIFVYRLFYNSFKTMTVASLFSIFGVLVGIFKTLLSHQKQ